MKRFATHEGAQGYAQAYERTPKNAGFYRSPIRTIRVRAGDVERWSAMAEDYARADGEQDQCLRRALDLAVAYADTARDGGLLRVEEE